MQNKLQGIQERIDSNENELPQSTTRVRSHIHPHSVLFFHLISDNCLSTNFTTTHRPNPSNSHKETSYLFHTKVPYLLCIKHSTCLKLCCYFKYIRSLFLMCHWQGFWVLFPSHEPRGFYCMTLQSIRFLGTCILCHSRTDRRSVCVGYYSCVYFLALLKRQTMTPQKQWAHLAPRSEILKVIFQ